MQAPHPQQPPYIPGISVDPARKSTLNALIWVALALAVVVVSLWVLDQKAETAVERQREVSEMVPTMSPIVSDAVKLELAIREQRVLVGMTRYEVRMAKGDPSERMTGPRIPQVVRDTGAVEVWTYQWKGSQWVYFGTDGLVIDATELRGKPLREHTIRQ